METKSDSVKALDNPCSPIDDRGRPVSNPGTTRDPSLKSSANPEVVARTSESQRKRCEIYLELILPAQNC